LDLDYSSITFVLTSYSGIRFYSSERSDEGRRKRAEEEKARCHLFWFWSDYLHGTLQLPDGRYCSSLSDSLLRVYYSDTGEEREGSFCVGFYRLPVTLPQLPRSPRSVRSFTIVTALRSRTLLLPLITRTPRAFWFHFTDVWLRFTVPFAVYCCVTNTVVYTTRSDFYRYPRYFVKVGLRSRLRTLPAPHVYVISFSCLTTHGYRPLLYAVAGWLLRTAGYRTRLKNFTTHWRSYVHILVTHLRSFDTFYLLRTLPHTERFRYSWTLRFSFVIHVTLLPHTAFTFPLALRLRLRTGMVVDCRRAVYRLRCTVPTFCVALLRLHTRYVCVCVTVRW